MRRYRNPTAIFAALVLSSCGGGGGSGSGGGSPPTGGTPAPPPTPSLAVTLSQNGAALTVPEGGSATFGFTASYTGTSSDPVVADVKVGGRRYVLDGAPTQSGTQFTVRLKTVPFPAGGSTKSDVTFRLCKTSDCAVVYPGSTVTYPVVLDVQLGDWETMQRNAAHTGYVAVAYDEKDFRPAWSETTRDYWTESVATRGAVFLNRNGGNSDLTVMEAFRPSDGSVLWKRQHENGAYTGGHPTVTQGRVAAVDLLYFSVNQSMPIINAQSGTVLGSVPFTVAIDTGLSASAAPVAFGDEMFLLNDNRVQKFDLKTYSRQWQSAEYDSAYRVVVPQTVAVDQSNVYFYDGSHLVKVRKGDGAIIGRFSFLTGKPSSYNLPAVGSSVLLDGKGHAIVPQLGYSNGAAAFDLATGKEIWGYGGAYNVQPAYGNGIVYLYNDNTKIVHFIEVASGKAVGSIRLPEDMGLSHNMILTENHLFVSGRKAGKSITAAYALKQTGRPMVWSADVQGNLTLTPDNQLVVSGVSDGVHAFNLH